MDNARNQFQRHWLGQRQVTLPANFENPLCAQIGGDLWFLEGKGETYSPVAINICKQCEHRIECAEYAIPFYNLDGLWGGLTPKQRLTIRQAEGIPGKSIWSFDL